MKSPADVDPFVKKRVKLRLHSGSDGYGLLRRVEGTGEDPEYYIERAGWHEGGFSDPLRFRARDVDGDIEELGSHV